MSAYIREQKGRKPTGLDVRIDAARILDELLAARIDPNLRSHKKVQRNHTEQNNIKISHNSNGLDKSVLRSNTLPSNYRESTEKLNEKNDIECLPGNDSHEQKTKHFDAGSGSSADTEDNLSRSSEKRKKKSLFKRAKERFFYTFRRNQKNGPATENGKHDTTDFKNLKSDKQGDKIISESNHHVRGHIGVDKSVVEYTEESSYKNKDGILQSKEHSVKPVRGNIFSSFRKSKKSLKIPGRKYNQGDSNGKSHQQENNIKDGVKPDAPEGQSSLQGTDIKQDTPSPYVINHRSVERQEHDNLNNDKQKGTKQSLQQLPDNQQINGNIPFPVGDTSFVPRTPISFFTISPEDALVAPDEGSVISDLRQYTKQGGRELESLVSIQSNVLDNPGDDIEYIDKSDSESQDKHENEGSRGNISHLLAHSEQSNNTSFFDKVLSAVGSPAHGRLTDFELDERVVAKQTPDGNTEITTTITTVSRVIIPEGEVEYDELDGHVDELQQESQKSSPDKDVMYSLIAQKLIDMGDSYSASLPDNNKGSEGPDTTNELDGHVDELQQDSQKSSPDKEVMYSLIAQKLIDIGDSYSASLPDNNKGSEGPDTNPLSPFEEEIIDCIRSIGDMASSKATQDTYQRFHSTMQNSLGSELSWNHVAFLFHTTKGVITAFGKGTRSALMVKDFTLQYVSDTFASWIVDQGGFDTLLSSDESDFGVD